MLSHALPVTPLWGFGLNYNFLARSLRCGRRQVAAVILVPHKFLALRRYSLFEKVLLLDLKRCHVFRSLSAASFSLELRGLKSVQPGFICAEQGRKNVDLSLIPG